MALSWILIAIALLILLAALIISDISYRLSNLDDRMDKVEWEVGLLTSQAPTGENPRFKSRFK